VCEDSRTKKIEMIAGVLESLTAEEKVSKTMLGGEGRGEGWGRGRFIVGSFGYWLGGQEEENFSH
jgi:hypothetical protein